MKLYSTIVSITAKTFCGAHYIFRQFNYFLKLFTKITWEDTNFDSSQFCNFAPPLPNEIFSSSTLVISILFCLQIDIEISNKNQS